ncbi:MAG: replicative DNA helicase [Patescibacteria group bacterium]
MALKKNSFKEARSGISNISLRILPQNLEAEMSVLGSLMLDGRAIIRVVDILDAEDFYNTTHRQIYESMTELFSKREPIDLLSVSTRLKERNLMDAIGGTTYLASLVNAVPTASNVAHYAEIVRKKAVLRNLIDVSGQISELGYKEDEDVGALLETAEKKIFKISERSLRQNFMAVKSTLGDAWNRIEQAYAHKGELRGVKSGFHGLDNVLSGLQKSDLLIIAARPSFGKTSLGLDIARHVAINEKRPVGIFSLEMSIEQLVDRLISAEARVNMHNLRSGKLAANEEDLARIQASLSRLSEAPIFIDDEGSNTILQMRAMARRLKAEHDLGLVVVDYLQLIQPQRGYIDNMVTHITEVSRSLKAMAKELNVPILALAQLSRAVDQRSPPKPRLSDLRDSGSIEQDADVVMLMYREDKYRENTDRKNQVDIEIAKHRNGPTGETTLYFNEDIASFSNMENNGNYE